MSYEPLESGQPQGASPSRKLRRFPWVLHLVLFLLTFFTTTVAGLLWLNLDQFELRNFLLGLPYSLSLLFILATHEFGHYFAARYHRVEATLPFFIPFPPFITLNFGTLGAVIRTRSVVPSRKVMFDIGAAGPLAGFVACLIVLAYGFSALPPREYILSIHPDFDFTTNSAPGGGTLGLAFGDNLMLMFFRNIFHGQGFIPPMSEIYHYPYLCVGWFGLFVTAMNLIPIGQLDGGHIIYTMFGERHKKIALGSFIGLILLGLPSMLDSVLRGLAESYYREPFEQTIPFVEYSWGGWLFWAAVLYTIVKLYHPPVPDETPIDENRMWVGWLCLIVFVLCFTFVPFQISLG
ncbi:MAG: site-2 protease family protein [Ignavibacteriales bacterium]|nr:site-2 protease family protein [Ignavibacteriales bacterium]